MSDTAYIEMQPLSTGDGDSADAKSIAKHGKAGDPITTIATLWARRQSKNLLAVALLFLMIFGGAGIFQALELLNPPQLYTNALNQSVYYYPNETWTYLNSVYFCVVTLTTIGYGDLQVSGNGSGVFIVFYLMFGIGTMSLALTTLPQLAGSMLKGCVRRIRRIDDDNDDYWMSPRTRLIAGGVSIGIYAVIGAAIFSALEQWSYGIALYFTIITLTTIGYGDVSPQTASGRVFLIVYALIGIGWLVLNISAIASIIFERTKKSISTEKHELCMGGPCAWLKRNRVPVAALCVMAAYVLLGGLCMVALENSWQLQNSTEPTAWTYRNALYFTLVTLTTVGYGDLVPTNSGSRAFVCCYAIVGLVGMTVTLSILAATAIEYARERAKRTLSNLRAGGTTAAPSCRVHPRLKLLLAFVAIWAYAMFGTAVFMPLQSMPFELSLYFTMITITTIGYGGMFSANTQDARAFWVFYALGGIFVVTVLLGWFGESMVESVSNATTKLRSSLRRISSNKI